MILCLSCYRKGQTSCANIKVENKKNCSNCEHAKWEDGIVFGCKADKLMHYQSICIFPANHNFGKCQYRNLFQRLEDLL